nr:alpha/beta hydrolase fold domain-containing protein [Microvirga antarctica]
MQRLLQVVADDSGPPVDPTTLPASEGRSLSEQANLRWNRDLPDMASVTDIVVPADRTLGSADCRVRIMSPHRASDGAILFVHGGGFAFCSPQTHERCARLLAIESGLSVVVPDYRLAPEHPYPAGLMDVIATLRACLWAPQSTGALKGDILVAGDSAGANLALAALIHEHREGRQTAAGALLFYGVYAADFETPSYRQFVDGPGLTTGKMQRYWDWYVQDSNRRLDPLVSPVRASDDALLALPPLYLMAAGIDPLLSDSLHLAARLQSLGRSERVDVVPGVVHGFLQMSSELIAARQALADAGSAARRMTTNRQP